MGKVDFGEHRLGLVHLPVGSLERLGKDLPQHRAGEDVDGVGQGRVGHGHDAGAVEENPGDGVDQGQQQRPGQPQEGLAVLGADVAHGQPPGEFTGQPEVGKHGPQHPQRVAELGVGGVDG